MMDIYDDDPKRCAHCDKEFEEGASKYFGALGGVFYCSEKCLRKGATTRSKDRMKQADEANKGILSRILNNPKNLKPGEAVDTSNILGPPETAKVGHPYKG